MRGECEWISQCAENYLHDHKMKFKVGEVSLRNESLQAEKESQFFFKFYPLLDPPLCKGNDG